ncbi:hypothetical protein Bca4012_059294 [Brassica carinata]
MNRLLPLTQRIDSMRNKLDHSGAEDHSSKLTPPQRLVTLHKHLTTILLASNRCLEKTAGEDGRIALLIHLLLTPPLPLKRNIATDSQSNWVVEMDCPNVEVLILNISSPNFALPSFIAGMKKLKVLIITNHASYPSNLKRIRLEKVSVALLDILQLKLVRLKKLSLVMCSSFGELPYWVCQVVSLKTLSITNCNKLSLLSQAIGNLSKLEVLRLSSCINLSELPETVERLGCFRFLDISHCLGLRKLPLEIGKLQKMSMRKCWRCELPDSVRDLEDLEMKCDEETGLVLWKRLKPKTRNLRVQEEETEHNLNLLQMF